MATTMTYFVRDFYYLLYERAQSAKMEADTASQGEAQAARAFAAGRARAYYEVVSLFINQATSFDLNLETIEVRIGDDDTLLNQIVEPT
jgi:hypothetical protein